MLRRLFFDHPASVGETYLQHLMHASYFAIRMLLAGVACFIHAVVPCLFQSTGRRAITELHSKMVLHRSTLTNHDVAQGPTGSANS